MSPSTTCAENSVGLAVTLEPGGSQKSPLLPYTGPGARGIVLRPQPWPPGPGYRSEGGSWPPQRTQVPTSDARVPTRRRKQQKRLFDANWCRAQLRPDRTRAQWSRRKPMRLFSKTNTKIRISSNAAEGAVAMVRSFLRIANSRVRLGGGRKRGAAFGALRI